MNPAQTATTNAPVRRFRPRFSLRVLFAVMLLGAAVLAWTFNRLHEQRKAIAFVVARGAKVTFEHQLTNLEASNRRDWTPKWLRQLMGEDTHIRWVGSAQPTDELVASLSTLSNLPNVALSNVVTDSMIERVADIKSLESLFLGGNFTDAGVVHLRRLPRLKTLQLRSFRLTDRTLDSLQELTSLEILLIEGGVERGSRPLTEEEIADGDEQFESLSAEAEARLRAALPKCKVVVAPVQTWDE